MPSLGADMEAGTLTEWLVGPGDVVRRGDVVAVVDTEKAAIEVECFTAGVVDELLVEPGATVPVGTVLATVTTAAEQAPAYPAPPVAAPEEPAAREPPVQPVPAPQQPGPAVAPVPAAQPPGRPAAVAASPLTRRRAAEAGIDLSRVRGTGRGGAVTRADLERFVSARGATRPRVSPYARRLARELGVEVSGLTGSGPGGAVGAADVRRAAERVSAAPPEKPPELPAELPAEKPPQVPVAQAVPQAAGERREAMRRAIGTLMARSKREVPHYYLSTTVDMSRASAWLRDTNRRLPVAERLVPAVLLLKAAAVAATRVPQLNGYWVDDRFEPAGAVHLGVAVALRGGGVIAPALHDAARASVSELMPRLRDLVNRSRAGRLRGSEMAESTITVTSLGDQGVEAVFGVIYPPQVALVGFGKVTERPWAVDGLLGVRPVVTATLSADHRASDGYTGARFLDSLDRLLQRPEEL